MTSPIGPDQAAATGPVRLVRLDAARHAEGRGRGEGRKQIARRLRALRAEMGRCVALAFVVTADDLAGQRRRVRAARLMFGCPVGAFDSIGDAVSWLADHGATASGEAGGVRPGCWPGNGAARCGF